eukprot:216422_1
MINVIYSKFEEIASNIKLERPGVDKIRIGDVIDICMQLNINTVSDGKSIIPVYLDNGGCPDLIFKASEIDENAPDGIFVRRFEWRDSIHLSLVDATTCLVELEATYDGTTTSWDVNPHKIDTTNYQDPDDANKNV